MPATAELARLPAIGDRVDRHRVLAHVATGGMAAVFAVERSGMGGFEKVLALKAMLPHLAADRYFVDMFLDEARIASQIHHANVVQVLDVVEHEGLPCIVMEYLHGRSFATVLARAEALGRPLPRVLRYAVLAGAAAGLRAAHAACGRDGLPLGVVHRDVSPQNVHVGFDGQIKVVDFGIAAARGRQSSTRSGQLKGKLEYLAPEQILAASSVGSAADAWSFGVMAWQTLGDARLFGDASDAATMWNVVHREVPPLRVDGEPLPDEIVRAVMGCLVREPERRIGLDACERAFTRAIAAVDDDVGRTLARTMGELFGDEQRVEQIELERTVARSRAQVQLAPEPVAASEPAPRGRGRVAALAIAGTIAAGVTAAFAAMPTESPELTPASFELAAPSDFAVPHDEEAPLGEDQPAASAVQPPIVLPAAALAAPAAPLQVVAPAPSPELEAVPAPRTAAKSRRTSPRKSTPPTASSKPGAPLFASPYGTKGK